MTVTCPLHARYMHATGYAGETNLSNRYITVTCPLHARYMPVT